MKAHATLPIQRSSFPKKTHPDQMVTEPISTNLINHVTQEMKTPEQSSDINMMDAIVTHTHSASQDDLVEQNLDLHNTFDLLGSDAENVTGEALLDDTDTLEVSEDWQGAVRNSPKVVPAEAVSYVNHTSLEAPGDFELLGVSVIPATSIRVVNTERLKAWVDTPVLTPMPQPITTSYASLTTDKLPSSQILVPASKSSFHSTAALKSVHILSKFWGDEVEEVMEDTPSHDQRLDLEDYPSLSESTKPERKKKKLMNKVKPSSFN